MSNRYIHRKSGRNRTHPEITHDLQYNQAESSPLLFRFSRTWMSWNQYPKHSSRHDIKRVPVDRCTNQRTEKQTDGSQSLHSRTLTHPATKRLFLPNKSTLFLRSYHTAMCLTGSSRTFIKSNAFSVRSGPRVSLSSPFISRHPSSL